MRKLLFIFVCLLPYLSKSQTTYYIDPSGNDATGNGTTRTLSFGSGFEFSSDLAAPSSTTAGKLLRLQFEYDASDNIWLCVQKLDNFN